DYPERWAPRDAEALVAHTDAYRIRLWEWLEGEVTGPWVLGTMRSALDLFVAVMVHWRPRPGERLSRTLGPARCGSARRPYRCLSHPPVGMAGGGG
ncbi:hypothetical protein CKQ90_31065, partial [Klebsiella pneumoniae]